MYDEKESYLSHEDAITFQHFEIQEMCALLQKRAGPRPSCTSKNGIRLHPAASGHIL